MGKLELIAWTMSGVLLLAFAITGYWISKNDAAKDAFVRGFIAGAAAEPVKLPVSVGCGHWYVIKKSDINPDTGTIDKIYIIK